MASTPKQPVCAHPRRLRNRTSGAHRDPLRAAQRPQRGGRTQARLHPRSDAARARSRRRRQSARHDDLDPVRGWLSTFTVRGPEAGGVRRRRPACSV